LVRNNFIGEIGVIEFKAIVQVSATGEVNYLKTQEKKDEGFHSWFE
jgi:hypothetical protein